MANEKIIVDLILQDKKFQQGIKDAVKDTKNLGEQGKSSGNMLASGFKVAAAAVAAIGLKELLTDLAKTAAQTQSVESAFKNSFDPSVLAGMRRAVNGTVDDLSLMQKALNAKNLKIPIDTLNAGLRLAKQRAAETGESVEFLAQSVVLGLGRESALILDNLGISAKRLSEETKRTGNFMKAAADIINTELANAPKTIDDLADSMAQTAAEVENLKGELAKELTPALMVLYSTLLESVKQTKTWLGVSTELTKEQKAHAEAVRNITEDYKYNLVTLEDVKSEHEKLEKRIERLSNIHGRNDIRVRNAVKEYKIYDDALKQINRTIDEANRKTSGFGGGNVEPIAIRQAQTSPIPQASGKEVVQDMRLLNDELEIMGQMWGMFAEADVMRKIALDTQASTDAAKAMTEGLKETNETLTAGDLLAIQFADSMVQGMFDAIAAGEDFGEVFRNVLKNLLASITQMILKMMILNALFPGFAGVAGGAGGGLLGRVFGFASGTNNFGGGLALVGEYGPELVSLPKGSSIKPHQQSMGMMGNMTLTSVIQGTNIVMVSDRTRNNRSR